MSRPFAFTPRGITLLEHRSGSEAHEDGRAPPIPIRFRRRRRTGPCACCLLDAGYVRQLELRLRRAERVAEANRRLALTDPLTGLPNRRHLAQRLDRVLARCALHPFSLAVFDVDDFKRFNDRHGHVAGDRVLAAIGAVLSRTCANTSAHPEAWDCADRPDSGERPVGRSGVSGPSHHVARLGGDEFVTTLPGNPPGKARDTARFMAKAVARHPQLSRHGVTVSFGVATLHAGMRRWQDALTTADRDLRRRRAAARPLPADRGFRYLWAQVLGASRLSRPPAEHRPPPRPARRPP